MKRVLLLLIFIYMLTGCKKEDAVPLILDISFTEHPEGGSSQNSIAVSYEGVMSGEKAKNEQIIATVEWWWENGFHLDRQLKSSVQVAFAQSGTTYKSSVYRAPDGYVLLNYYWVRITWTDDRGPQEIVSGKAYCSSK